MSKSNILLRRKTLLGDGTVHEVPKVRQFLHPDMWEVEIDRISTSISFAITQNLKVKRIIIDNEEVLSPSEINSQKTFENDKVKISSNSYGGHIVKFKAYNSNLSTHIVYFQLEGSAGHIYPVGYYKYIRTPKNLNGVSISKIRQGVEGYDSDGINLYLLSDSMVNISESEDAAGVLQSYLKNDANIYVPKEMLQQYITNNKYTSAVDKIQEINFAFVEDNVNT